MERLMRILTSIYKKPRLTALCGIIITGIFAAAIPFIRFDNDIKNFLSVSNPHRVNNERLNTIFGSSEIIIIGVESGNAYSKETVEYVKWLQGKIEELNWKFPAESISEELGLSIDESNKVIDAVNRYEVYGKESLGQLFSDPVRMSSELSWDMDFARKVSRKVMRASVDRVLMLYRLPVDDIKSVINTDFIRGEGDRFVVEKLVNPEKLDDKSIEELKQKVKSWKIFDRLLFSDNDRLTAMSIRMNPVDINLRQKFNIAVEKIIKDNPHGNLEVYMAGEPVISDRVSTSMGDDLGRLLPFVLFVMLFILVIIFRHYEGVVFPMIAMMVSVIWTLGTMALTGVPMSMVSISVPVVLTAVASAYGIHFMTHYFMSPGRSRFESCVESMKVGGLGIIMAAITTVVGFGSLATSDMTHIRNYGIITALGVFYSLIITVTLVPAFLLLRKSDKPVLEFTKDEGKADAASRLLNRVAVRTGRHPVMVLVIGAVLTVVSVFGLKFVEVSMNTMDFFQEGSDIKKADQVLNSMLSGTQLLNINIESKDGSEIIIPDVLKKVESFQADFGRSSRYIGKIISVNDYLKKMNQEMHGGDPAFYRLPETAQMAKEYLLLYSGDIDNMITKDMDKLRLHISIKRCRMTEQARIRDSAAAYFDSDFRSRNNVTVEPSGFLDMMVEANRLVFIGQISSLVTSLVVVALLMYLIFRNLRLTGVSLIPLVLGILMNFGIMGFLKIPLNAATALVASISIGMGIDYSIHFINQFRVAMSELHDVDAALARTYTGTGRAILSNVLSVMAGFLVLLFSTFPVIQQCGGLIAFTVTVTGIAAILLIPAALRLITSFDNKKYKQGEIYEK